MQENSIKTLNNWTNFFTDDKPVTIVSDTEGFLPVNYLEKLINKIQNEKVIFLGDLFDYTALGFKIDEKPERCCALLLMKQLMTHNTNVRCVLGNRDINKIKMLQLCQRKDLPGWWKSKDETNYDELKDSDLLYQYAKDLSEMTYEQINWLVKDEDFKKFWPYWNDHMESENQKKYKKWKGYNLEKSIIKRYQAIFGTDPIEGTMSAANTANGLANEIFGSEKVAKMGSAGKEEKMKLRAALVFVSFARLLDKNLLDSGKWKYDGLLYKYLLETPAIAFAETADKIYLFSHGGVQSSFNKDISKFKNVKWEELGINSELKQSGGTLSHLSHSNIFNQMMKQYFSDVFSNETKFSNEPHPLIQTLNSLGCGIFNSKTIQRLGGNFIKGESPMQSSIMGVLADTKRLVETNKEVINIFGHMPTGIGYTTGVNKNTGKFICCDFSMSCLKNGFDADRLRYDDNDLMLRYEGDRFILDGTVYLNKRIPTDKIPVQLSKDDNKKIYDKDVAIHGFRLETENLEIVYNDIELDHKFIEKLNYHGIAQINGNNPVRVYTMLGGASTNFAKLIVLKLVDSVVSNMKAKFNKQLGGKKTKTKKRSIKQRTNKTRSKRNSIKRQIKRNSNKRRTKRNTKRLFKRN